MIDELKTEGVPVKLWTSVSEVEYAALDQLKNVARLPWVFRHVAVMPDCHHGKGATVGSVIAMKGAVAPATVGVDIGCGMGAIRTSLTANHLPQSLSLLRSAIEGAIPVGFNEHAEPVKKFAMGIGGKKIENDIESLFSRFSGLDRVAENLEGKAQRQCGTLGGGNHFIELCLDDGTCEVCAGTGRLRYQSSDGDIFEECPGNCVDGKVKPRVWMMLHSGSRNIGKTLAEKHMGIAKKLAHNSSLPDPDLAAFLAGTPEMEAYKRDLFWAQEYAFLNRRVMFEIYKQVMQRHFNEMVVFDEPILCHHNYVSDETHFGEQLVVTRKGAISAKKGELGIIPGSMGTKSYIVEGLGNPDSYTSASHGAGRRMSRGAAKRAFKLSDLEAQTAGVECRKDAGVLDEIPGAYKDIDKVMENQRDLVGVVATLKQVLCVKG